MTRENPRRALLLFENDFQTLISVCNFGEQRRSLPSKREAKLVATEEKAMCVET